MILHDKKDIKILGGDVLILEFEDPDQLDSGLWMPPQRFKFPGMGKIVALGPGIWNKKRTMRLPQPVVIDELIVFNKYSGTKLQINDKSYCILPGDEILAIMK